MHHNLQVVISTPLLVFFPALEFINNHCKMEKGGDRVHVVYQLWFLCASFHLQDDYMFMLKKFDASECVMGIYHASLES